MNNASVLNNIAALMKKVKKPIKKKKYKLYGKRTVQQINRSIQCTRMKEENVLPYILISFIADPYWRKLMSTQLLHEILFYGYQPERMGAMMHQLEAGFLKIELYVQNFCLPMRIMPLGTEFPEVNIPVYIPMSKTFILTPHVFYALCLLIERNPFLTIRDVFPTTYLFCHLNPLKRLRHRKMIAMGLYLSLIQGWLDISPVKNHFNKNALILMDLFFKKCSDELLHLENDHE